MRYVSGTTYFSKSRQYLLKDGKESNRGTCDCTPYSFVHSLSSESMKYFLIHVSYNAYHQVSSFLPKQIIRKTLIWKEKHTIRPNYDEYLQRAVLTAAADKDGLHGNVQVIIQEVPRSDYDSIQSQP